MTANSSGQLTEVNLKSGLKNDAARRLRLPYNRRMNTKLLHQNKLNEQAKSCCSRFSSTLAEWN